MSCAFPYQVASVEPVHRHLLQHGRFDGIAQSLALELAPEILVNAIAPGPILAPPDLTPEDNARTIEATPLARWGGAEEIAKAVLFLVETDFVTGECIPVDGGRHLY